MPLSVLLTFAWQQVVGSTVAWIVRETLAMGLQRLHTSAAFQPDGLLIVPVEIN